MLRKLSRCFTRRAIDTHSRRYLWWAAYLNDVRSWSRGADWNELRVTRERLARQRKPESAFFVQYGEG